MSNGHISINPAKSTLTMDMDDSLAEKLIDALGIEIQVMQGTVTVIGNGKKRWVVTLPPEKYEIVRKFIFLHKWGFGERSRN
jgi:hypothetical protein